MSICSTFTFKRTRPGAVRIFLDTPWSTDRTEFRTSVSHQGSGWCASTASIRDCALGRAASQLDTNHLACSSGGTKASRPSVTTCAERTASTLSPSTCVCRSTLLSPQSSPTCCKALWCASCHSQLHTVVSSSAANPHSTTTTTTTVSLSAEAACRRPRAPGREALQHHPLRPRRHVPPHRPRCHG